MHNIVD